MVVGEPVVGEPVGAMVVGEVVVGEEVVGVEVVGDTVGDAVVGDAVVGEVVVTVGAAVVGENVLYETQNINSGESAPHPEPHAVADSFTLMGRRQSVKVSYSKSAQYCSAAAKVIVSQESIRP
jgi:hypothetical protein